MQIIPNMQTQTSLNNTDVSIRFEEMSAASLNEKFGADNKINTIIIIFFFIREFQD